MRCRIREDGISGGENSYITTDLEYSGSLVDINLTVYVISGRQLEHTTGMFQSHTVRLFHDRKDIIDINGHRLRVINMDVTYK